MEFLLVFPILIFTIFGVLQFGMLFVTWSSMYNAVRDTARHWAVGDITTEAAAEADVVTRLGVVSWVAAASWNASGTTKSGSQLMVSVTTPASNASPINLPLIPIPAVLTATVVIRDEG